MAPTAAPTPAPTPAHSPAATQTPALPGVAAYPEEAFVIEADDTAAAPVADENASAPVFDIHEPATPHEPDIVAISEGDAASERLAPVARADADISPSASPDADASAGDEAQIALPLVPEAADAAQAAEAEATSPAEPAADIRSDPGDMPSFVRSAERAARWRQPRVRAALALGCVAAAVVLAGQWIVAQRDLVAARSPGLKPALAAACAVLGCEVQAPRALEALRVESSGVMRVDKSDLYRLSVSLRNLRTHEVALPAFELALTDTQGQLMARRVLHAAEIGARAGSLAAGGELTLQCTIQVASGAVAGYTIELFYP